MYFLEILLCRLLFDEHRFDSRNDLLINDVLRDDKLLLSLYARNFEHYVEENLFNDCTESARAGLVLDGNVGYFINCILGERKVNVIDFKACFKLLRDGVLWFGENTLEVVAGELLERHRNREAADELRNDSEFNEVVARHLVEKVHAVLFGHTRCLCAKAD